MDDAILLTVHLRHQKDKNLGEINARLEEDRLLGAFPPDGVEVASWYVMMGIGQAVTQRVPTSRLLDVNLASERCVWGAFDTEFYATDDFPPVWDGIRARASGSESG